MKMPIPLLAAISLNILVYFGTLAPLPPMEQIASGKGVLGAFYQANNVEMAESQMINGDINSDTVENDLDAYQQYPDENEYENLHRRIIAAKMAKIDAARNGRKYIEF